MFSRLWLSFFFFEMGEHKKNFLLFSFCPIFFFFFWHWGNNRYNSYDSGVPRSSQALFGNVQGTSLFYFSLKKTSNAPCIIQIYQRFLLSWSTFTWHCNIIMEKRPSSRLTENLLYFCLKMFINLSEIVKKKFFCILVTMQELYCFWFSKNCQFQQRTNNLGILKINNTNFINTFDDSVFWET